jgi:hypothetical protein
MSMAFEGLKLLLEGAVIMGGLTRIWTVTSKKVDNHKINSHFCLKFIGNDRSTNKAVEEEFCFSAHIFLVDQHCVVYRCAFLHAWRFQHQ